jgi:hypothetical protein
MLVATATLVITACGGESPQSGSSVATAAPPAASAPADAPAVVPDACTFIPKADMEAIVGRELRDGKRHTLGIIFHDGK